MTDKAIMLAAPSSGSGKTLVTCGLLQALKNRGFKTASFKCGPDYIDPMFHKHVIGVESANIDLFFSGKNLSRKLFEENSKDSDIAVVEGVMGYYDGLSASSFEASSYDVSRTIGLPTILIVNTKGQSISSLAVLKGFGEFRADSNIKGVIFNNMSSHVYEAIKEKVEELTSLKPLGYLPNVKELTFESRHLGLIKPDEIRNLSEKLNKLANIMEHTIDIQGILNLAGEYKPTKTSSIDIVKFIENPKIAVARDEAFCFYYKDNLNILKKMGAQIQEFSPVHDDNLPEGTEGLILGGGYPELYADKLFNNQSMTKSIRKALNNGMPCLAECGGFMYLHEEMEDLEGNKHKALGIIPGKAYKTGKLGRFGYIKMFAKNDSLFMKKGETVKGHEFHYFDSESCGEALKATKPITGKSWECMNITSNIMAGFPHLYYYSNPDMVERFLRQALDYRQQFTHKVKET